MTSPYKRKEGYKNIVQFGVDGFPRCEKHGAMNSVSKDGKLWRCLTCGVGFSFCSVCEMTGWAKIEISVTLTNKKGDPVGFTVKIFGVPPTVETNRTLNEVIEILKEVYTSHNCLTLISHYRGNAK